MHNMDKICASLILITFSDCLSSANEYATMALPYCVRDGIHALSQRFYPGDGYLQRGCSSLFRPGSILAKKFPPAICRFIQLVSHGMAGQLDF